MQFTIQFTEAEDGGVLASTLRRIAAAFDPSAHITTAHKIVGFTDEPVVTETLAVDPITEGAPAHVETVTKTRRACIARRKAALDAALDAAALDAALDAARDAVGAKAALDAAVDTVAPTVAVDTVAPTVAVDTVATPVVDDIAAAYNAAAAAAGAPTVAEIEKAAEVDPEQERRTLLESIAPMLEKAGFPWYRANVPGGKRLAEISIDEARALHAKVTAHLGAV